MSVRRIVTGHDPDGKAVILSDGAVPKVFDELGPPGLAFMEIWETRAAPAPIAPREPEPTDHDLRLLPPAHGVRIRIVDLPPEGEGGTRAGADPQAVFEKIGAPMPGRPMRSIPSCTARRRSITASCSKARSR